MERFTQIKFFLLLLFVSSCADIVVDKQVLLNHGVIDLSEHDLKKDGPVRIRGKAHFVWREFVSKEEFKNSKKDIIAKSILVPFRMPWRRIEQIKNLQDQLGSGYGTLVLTVLLKPQKINNISLFHGGIYSASEIDVVESMGPTIKMGKIGRNSSEEEPSHYKAQFTFYLDDRAELQEINILIRISSHSDINGGYLLNNAVIGDKDDIEKLLSKEKFTETIAFGILSLLFLFYFVLFQFRREDKGLFYFSVVCFFGALRLALINDIFEPLFGSYGQQGYFIDKRIELMPQLFGPVAFMAFIETLYPNNNLKRAAKIFLVLGFIQLIIVMSIDYYTVTRLFQLNFFYIILIVFTLIYYLLKFSFHENREKRRTARVIFLFGLIPIGGLVHDVLIFVGLHEASFVTSYCVIIFYLCQSYLLSKNYSQTFLRVRQLSEKLSIEVEKKTMESSFQRRQIEDQLGKIQSDLFVAGEVMKVMLPENYHDDYFCTVDFLFTPAGDLAGDLYGMEYHQQKLLLWICDVTGHGVAASLVAGVIRESIAVCNYKYIFCQNPKPAQALEFISNRVEKAVSGEFYATMNLMVLDYRESKLHLANAAHSPPFFFDSISQTTKMLKMKTGPLIGSHVAGTFYEDMSIDLKKGDLVFAFTDGLSEAAFDVNSRPFGRKRIKKFIDRYHDDNRLNRKLFDQMLGFQGKIKLDDDVTMMALKIK